MRTITKRRCAAAMFVLCAVLSVPNGRAAEAGRLSAVYAAVDQKTAELSVRVESLERSVRTAAGSGSLLDDSRNKVQYQVCQALTMDNPGACGMLENQNSSDGKTYSPQTECRDLYWRLAQSKILMTASEDAAGARALCMAMLTRPEMRGLKADPGVLCGVYVGHANDARQRAAKMSALLKNSEDAASLERKERLVMGLGAPAECQAQAGSHGWSGMAGCETARVYRAAHAKKDMGLCGNSGLCRALMGQKTGTCAFYADIAGRTASAGELRKSLGETQRALLEVIASLDSIEPKGLAAVANRRKKLSSLLARCNALSSSLIKGKKADR